MMYYADDAKSSFEENISEARSGILSSEEELARLNTLLSPLIKQGQSIHQIYINHVDELMCSEKTLYNYIDACLFDVNPELSIVQMDSVIVTLCCFAYPTI